MALAAYVWGKKKATDAAEDPKNINISPAFQQKQNLINDHLVALRILSGADRAKIGQFHNGGKFLDGTSMKRFSVTHESCEIGVPFDGQTLQNIVVTIFWDMIAMSKQNKSDVVFTKDLPLCHYQAYCRSHGVDAILILPIRREELYIGFLLVEWCDVDKIPQDLERVKKIAEEHRAAIEVEMLLRA